MKFLTALIVCTLLLQACNRQSTLPEDKAIVNNSFISDTLYHLESNTQMILIPGGKYEPFFVSDSSEISVQPFLLDENPVTNQAFLEFVKANPQWRKSNVKSIYTDSTYLRDWVNDTTLPDNARPDAPVCFVSWFAAKAYAQSVGKRLPTLDEWEFVGMADTDTFNARKKPSYSNHIIGLYSQKDRQFNSVKESPPNYWKVYNMFDLIWEWTDDFNSILATGDSRAGEYDDKGLFCAGSATSASDNLNYAAFMRFALRTSIKANYTLANLGFRCAKDTIIVHQNKEL